MNVYTKFHAKKTTIDGITFASQKEGRRYLELKALLRAGKISDLKLQVPFELIPTHRLKSGKTVRKRQYIADFTYCDTMTGEKIVEDVKGFRTKEYTLKRDMMWDKYGIEIKET